MARQLPEKALPWLRMAERLGPNYPYPLGRVVYLLGRKAATWPHVVTGPKLPGGAPRPIRPKTELEVLMSCRPETAKRWEEHWLAGGSHRRLGTSDEDYKKERQRARDRWLTEGQKLRKMIRAARRRPMPAESEDL